MIAESSTITGTTATTEFNKLIKRLEDKVDRLQMRPLGENERSTQRDSSQERGRVSFKEDQERWRSPVRTGSRSVSREAAGDGQSRRFDNGQRTENTYSQRGRDWTRQGGTENQTQREASQRWNGGDQWRGGMSSENQWRGGAVQRGNGQSWRRSGTMGRTNGQQNSQQLGQCFRCGRVRNHNDQQCPARTAVCFNCHKIGHLKSVCRQGRRTQEQC